MADAMLPAELEEVTAQPVSGDEVLTAAELASLSIFDEIKKAPNFARFRGTTFLRKCASGRAVVRQGQGGSSAFSILTSEDVLGLRESQLKSIQETREAQKAGEEGSHDFLRN